MIRPDGIDAVPPLASKRGGGGLLNNIPLLQMKQSKLQVRNPQASRSTLGDRTHSSMDGLNDLNEPVIIKVTNGGVRGGPDSSLTILKQRIRIVPIQLPIRFSPAVAFAEDRDLTVVPTVQTIGRREPHASVFVRQNGADACVQQTLVGSKCDDRIVPKAVKA